MKIVSGFDRYKFLFNDNIWPLCILISKMKFSININGIDNVKS